MHFAIRDSGISLHSSSCFRFKHWKQKRHLATVYAVGEGWTGAFGTGRLDDLIPGHFDENRDGLLEKNSLPIEIFTGDVKSCSVGWGHTAIVSGAFNQSLRPRLLVSGRPQEFTALLRLKRLPKILRDYSVKRTLMSSLGTASTLNPFEVIGRVLSFLSNTFNHGIEDWENARLQSSMASFTEINLHEDNSNLDVKLQVEEPTEVVCSAGLTALLMSSGSLYTFGLNEMGQCGIGFTSTNVWRPEKVRGLCFDDVPDTPRAELDQTYPVLKVALGLQHALCLNSNGEMFAWGKAERGQLGQEVIRSEVHTAVPIRTTIELIPGKRKPIYHPLGKVQQIGAGMIHSAALDSNNNVYVWGKNILPNFVDTYNHNPKKTYLDAKIPFRLEGLPPNLNVVQISCGSHHTSVLMEDGSVWASGISSDTREMIRSAICLIPPGVIDLPVRQFEAHMDRTTVVGADGRQVLQVHVWQDPELRKLAFFTPAWIQALLDADKRVCVDKVHRSWIHSVAVCL